MLFLSPNCRLTFFAVGLSLILTCFSPSLAQVDDITGENDPIKLFERGQSAHAKGDLERAIAFYEAAIKLRPEFPEAEYQRGIALITLARPAEAEKALRRAIELRKDWPLPYTALANVLVRSNHDKEAESLLRRALELGAKDYLTLDALAAIRLRGNDKSEALSLATRATADADPAASAWALRAFIEREAGDNTAAMNSVEQALSIDSKNVSALETRAELRADAGDYPDAIEDLKAALAIRPDDKDLSEHLTKMKERVEHRTKPPSGRAFDQKAQLINATADEIEAANSEDPAIAIPALEKLVVKNPKNAGLWAKLGELTRTKDPAKSLSAYREANLIDPSKPNYATGYAAALIQLHRFAEAVPILRQVINGAPEDYPAHANLALALHELKRFAEALPVWDWMISNRPDVAATYFYIAIAHDNLGEYQQALDAYERFLAHANAAKNQLEIEKVNLRLPRLRDQIKRGQGIKPKKP
jgi:tetratricopeptide (TPR) repeat protein